MTEREQFEAWWIPLNYKQVSENIAWLAWQARAALSQQQAEPDRCKYCGVIDGDGHTGDCALALGLVSTPVQQQAEPVAYRLRTSNISWGYFESPSDGCEPLYAAPPADEAVRLRAVLRNVIRDAGETRQELREHAWKIIRERWEVLNPNGGPAWGDAELQEDAIADAAIDAYLARVKQ